RIEVGGMAGTALEIETTGFTEPTHDGPAQYVQSVHLDGRPLDRSWLSGSEVHRGGRLVVGLGPEPSGWGTAGPGVRPPSSASPVRGARP
ncbi:hypothetical protein ACQUZK_09595, partial [Streptococcus pyogenes]|uniref:hypothetical protein n=1 Tax=Streptococcus pyogenes TaxID=1314 RepID=UPI003DA056DE